MTLYVHTLCRRLNWTQRVYIIVRYNNNIILQYDERRVLEICFLFFDCRDRHVNSSPTHTTYNIIVIILLQ